MIATIALTTAVVLAPAQVGAAPGRGGNPNPAEARVEGTIVGVNPAAVAIRTQAGAVVTVLVIPATKVERNGIRVPLSAFRLGDRGQARFLPATGVATKVEAVGP